MALSSQFDAVHFPKVTFPYNKIESELSEEPRLVSGSNLMATVGGKLTKRMGTLTIASTDTTRRADRLWLYETLEATPKVYFLASFYDTATSKWMMFYNRPATATGWVTMGATRDLNASTRPHECTTSRGLAYIKGFPASGSSEKLGTAIFDGSGASPKVRLWGLLGPTVPAKVKGSVTRITVAVASGDTAWTVADTWATPATPFTAQIEYEQVTVTGVVGTAWTVTRAVNGTSAAAHDANSIVLWRNWSASDHRVDVNLGWTYTYAYKTITDHLSNRAALQTNMDLAPSITGPFFDLKPVMTIKGHADTTNVPKLAVYRSTDGGGTYFKLEEVTNTGAVDIDYTDDSLGTGATSTTYNDPQPDANLDRANIAPSLTSNSPPPTVVSPLVTGTDTVAASTPLVEYQSRIWFGIDNLLFYSASEELNEGIPEEAFPSGLKGNYFRFRYPIRNLISTTDGLYITTQHITYKLTGSNLETFNPQPAYAEFGSPTGHPRAATSWGRYAAWMTHDYRIVVAPPDADPMVINGPLYDDISTAVAAGAEIELKYWGDLEKEYLFVIAHRTDDTTLSRTYAYDLNLSRRFNPESTLKVIDFWNVPWAIRSVAALSGRINESSSRRRMVYGIWDGTNFRLVYLDPTGATATDLTPAGVAGGFAVTCDTNLFGVPEGNHVNSLRRPGFVPVVSRVELERTEFASDTDPSLYYFREDLYTVPVSLTTQAPSRRADGTGYKTLVAPLNKAVYRFGLRISKDSSTERFELQTLSIIYEPEAGA